MIEETRTFLFQECQKGIIKKVEKRKHLKNLQSTCNTIAGLKPWGFFGQCGGHHTTRTGNIFVVTSEVYLRKETKEK